mmetsp:Transcript_92531/g.167134  ORF Transcript_92531/g.167134 Transcript_92531/m.167134 type:complete len:157 (-) Transcript_92531:801-1271(-)
MAPVPPRRSHASHLPTDAPLSEPRRGALPASSAAVSGPEKDLAAKVVRKMQLFAERGGSSSSSRRLEFSGRDSFQKGLVCRKPRFDRVHTNPSLLDPQPYKLCVVQLKPLAVFNELCSEPLCDLLAANHFGLIVRRLADDHCWLLQHYEPKLLLHG